MWLMCPHYQRVCHAGRGVQEILLNLLAPVIWRAGRGVQEILEDEAALPDRHWPVITHHNIVWFRFFKIAPTIVI